MGRFELKFPVPEADVGKLQRLLSRYLATDVYGSQGAYTVRSIYFDSPTLTAYHEKLAGICHRQKLRVRGYDTPTSNANVFLEIKRKDDMIISKVRSKVPYADLDYLFPHESLSGSVFSNQTGGDDPGQFLYNVRRHRMRPVVLIKYNRIAYYAPSGSQLRVTIDRDIRAAAKTSMNDLFSEDPTLPVLPGVAVLEVKFPVRMPPWLESYIDCHGYEREAVSKYALGIDRCGIVSNKYSAARLKSRTGIHGIAGILRGSEPIDAAGIRERVYT